MRSSGSWRRAWLAALVAVPCTSAALAAPAQAIKTVEYHRGITQVSNAKDGGDPRAITAGPDGNLWWMTEPGGPGIVKITPPRGTCVVPRVVGLHYPAAVSRLHRAGCTVGTLRELTEGGLLSNTRVVRQGIAPGRRLPRESSVPLTVR